MWLESVFSQPVSDLFFSQNPVQPLTIKNQPQKISAPLFASALPVTKPAQSQNLPLSASSAQLFIYFTALSGAKGLGMADHCFKT